MNIKSLSHIPIILHAVALMNMK